MLSHIKTVNFKKLGTFSAEFTEGTNLILGGNGFGKTTIFNAVRFALFGTQAIASSSENIPTWGTSKVEVDAGFLNDFLVVRTLKDCKIFKAAEDGSLSRDPALKVAEGSTPCSAWVKQHLGLDHKMFSIFNMSMQGETGALITLGATELNRIVENYSGVGVLDTVIKSVSKETGQIEGALGTVEYTDTKELKQLTEKLTLELVQHNEAVTFERTVLDELTAEQDTRQKRYVTAVNHNKTVAAQLQERAGYKSKLETLAPRIRELTISLAKGKKDLSAVNFSDMEVDIVTRKEKLSNFNKDSLLHSNYESQLTKLEDAQRVFAQNSLQESEVATQRLSLESSIESQQLALEELQKNALAAISSSASAKANLESGSCSECHRAFEDFDPESAQLTFDTSVSHKQTCTNLVTQCKSNIESLKLKLRNLPNVGVGNEEKSQKCLIEIESLKVNITALEDRYEHFDEADELAVVNNLESELNRLRIIRSQYGSDEVSLNSEKESYNVTEQLLESLGEVAENQPTVLLEASLESGKEQLATQRNDLDNIVKAAQDVQGKLTTSKHELTQLETANADFAQYSGDIDKGKRLVKFLRDSRTDYMVGVWSLILGAATGWINDTTGGWITQVGRDKKTGNFTFTENGIVQPVFSEASGAQKEFIGTALRIGLGMSLLGSKGMLMLDEPTAGMREDNADKLATGLLGVAGQKIIITHRQSEKLTAANVVNL